MPSLIMTSNVGLDLIAGHRQPLGFSGPARECDASGGSPTCCRPYAIQLMRRLREHFRPEFVNRIDEVIVFHRLDQRAPYVRSRS